MKALRIAIILLCIVSGYGLVGGIWATVATNNYIQTWADIMDTSVTGSAVLTMAVQFFGVYLFVSMLAIIIIAVIPFQKAERWSWYAILALGGIGLAADTNAMSLSKAVSSVPDTI